MSSKIPAVQCLLLSEMLGVPLAVANYCRWVKGVWILFRFDMVSILIRKNKNEFEEY